LIIDNVIYAPNFPVPLLSPQELQRQSKEKGYNQSHVTTDENTATLFHVGATISCDYHPKAKLPMISCIPLLRDKQTTTPVKPSLLQQPSNKGRKRVALLEPKEITAYTSNLNTAQQELLQLHDTYAHANMQEIQYKIKHRDIKSTRQVALYQIPKCQSCCNNKSKKRSQKRHCGSIM
jgi:hypothetical protein